MIKSFQQFLIEQKIPIDIKEKFGEILFGDLYYSDEEDTDYEREVLRAVEKHLRPMGDAPNLNLIKDLLKYKKYYPDILEPNDYKYLYRGLIINIHKSPKQFNVIKQALGGITDESQLKRRYELPNWWVELPKTVKYNPRSEVQSWTAMANIAADFAGNVYGDDYLSYIVAAKPPRKEMLFNTDFTSKLSHTNEFEIVRVSKKPLKCKICVRTPINEILFQ